MTATVALMLLTLPVFAIAAIVCLPVALLALAARSLWPVLQLLSAAPNGRSQSARPR